MKIDIRKINSIKRYAEKNGVTRTSIDKWIKEGCINKKTNEKFRIFDIGGITVIID